MLVLACSSLFVTYRFLNTYYCTSSSLTEDYSTLFSVTWRKLGIEFSDGFRVTIAVKGSLVKTCVESLTGTSFFSVF